MIRTHPEESAPESFLLFSDSLLRVESLLRLVVKGFSQLDLPMVDLWEAVVDEEEGLSKVDWASALALGRPVILPIRNRGTLV